MNTKQQISAQIERDGRFWLVYVPEIDQHTQGRSIKEAREMAIDVAATWLEVPLDDIELVNVQVDLPKQAAQLIAEAAELRGIAEAAQRDAAIAVRVAAAELRAAGLTMRDIGAALGVSHQRANQLVAPGRLEPVAPASPEWAEFVATHFPSTTVATTSHST